MEGGEELFTADAVVLAVGATAAARLRASSPVLLAQPSTRGFDRLRGITCVAVRLYLSPASYRTAGLGGGAFDSTLLPAQVASAMVASPVLVAGPAIGGLPELRETGFCVYDLQRLHPELASGDLAVLEVTEIAGEHSPPHSVYSSRLSVGARTGFDRGSTPSPARTSPPGPFCILALAWAPSLPFPSALAPLSGPRLLCPWADEDRTPPDNTSPPTSNPAHTPP